jgi:hypothetical protein
MLVSNYDDQQRYYSAACKILLSLCTNDANGGFLARDVNGDPKSPGIIVEGCYNHPYSASGGSLYNKSLIWGDYYLVEAILRYQAVAAP